MPNVTRYLVTLIHERPAPGSKTRPYGIAVPQIPTTILPFLGNG
jgi:hypothetical protein